MEVGVDFQIADIGNEMFAGGFGTTTSGVDPGVYTTEIAPLTLETTTGVNANTEVDPYLIETINEIGSRVLTEAGTLIEAVPEPERSVSDYFVKAIDETGVSVLPPEVLSEAPELTHYEISPLGLDIDLEGDAPELTVVASDDNSLISPETFEPEVLEIKHAVDIPIHNLVWHGKVDILGEIPEDIHRAIEAEFKAPWTTIEPFFDTTVICKPGQEQKQLNEDVIVAKKIKSALDTVRSPLAQPKIEGTSYIGPKSKKLVEF